MDIDKARLAGYSDDEISQELGRRYDGVMNVGAAAQAGYKPEDIFNEITRRTGTIGPAAPGFGEQFKADPLGAVTKAIDPISVLSKIVKPLQQEPPPEGVQLANGLQAFGAGLMMPGAPARAIGSKVGGAIAGAGYPKIGSAVNLGISVLGDPSTYLFGPESEANAAVKSGQEMPAFQKALSQGLGQPLPVPKSSNLADVYSTVKNTSKQLGNNIGQIVQAAQDKIGPINPASLRPKVGNAISTALQNAPIVSSETANDVNKWFANKLPQINDLNDLHKARIEWDKAAGVMGKEGDISSVSQAAVHDAMAAVLKDYMPPDLRDSFNAANTDFSNFKTLENGLKVSTTNLGARLKGRMDVLGSDTDPAKFKDWYQNTLTDEEKSKLQPLLKQNFDALTADPNTGKIKGFIQSLANKVSDVYQNIPIANIKEPPLLKAFANPKAAFSVPSSSMGQTATPMFNIPPTLYPALASQGAQQ